MNLRSVTRVFALALIPAVVSAQSSELRVQAAQHMAASPEHYSLNSELYFSSQAIPAPVLNVRFGSFQEKLKQVFWTSEGRAVLPAALSGARRGMRKALGGQKEEPGLETLRARLVTDARYAVSIVHGDEGQKGLPRSMTDWRTALLFAFSHAARSEFMAVIEFLRHYALDLYRNSSFISFYEIPDKTPLEEWRGIFGFDSVLLKAPAVFAHLAVPHELAHALLADIHQPHLEEIAVMARDVKRLLQIHFEIRPDQMALTNEVAVYLAKQGFHRVGREKVYESLSEQILDELEEIEGRSLQAFYAQLLRGPKGLIFSSEQIIKLVVSYIRNNPHIYPQEAAALEQYASAQASDWEALAAEISKLDALIDTRLGMISRREPILLNGAPSAPGRRAFPVRLFPPQPVSAAA